MGTRSRSGSASALADGALWVACLTTASRSATVEERARQLLSYLAVFPTGLHNRRAAEAVERCLDELEEEAARAELQRRLRALRDPHMPPMTAESATDLPESAPL